MKQAIEIIVTPSGETTVQTHGFTGPSCRDVSKFLQEALGRTSAERFTSKYYQTTDTETHNRQKT